MSKEDFEVDYKNCPTNEALVKRDLDSCINVGVAYYRGVPVKNFSKEQLITILCLLCEKGEEINNETTTTKTRNGN